MVRKLETRAQFQATLLMKVPKWGGLGTEWKPRCADGAAGWEPVLPGAPPGTRCYLAPLSNASVRPLLPRPLVRLHSSTGSAVAACCLVRHGRACRRRAGLYLCRA